MIELRAHGREAGGHLCAHSDKAGIHLCAYSGKPCVHFLFEQSVLANHAGFNGCLLCRYFFACQSVHAAIVGPFAHTVKGRTIALAIDQTK